MAAGAGRGGHAGCGGRGGGRGGGGAPAVAIDDAGWWDCPLCFVRRRDNFQRHIRSHQYEVNKANERRQRQVQEREQYNRAHNRRPNRR
ncbi:hypothetical protein ACQJBY_019301 [Aegilops geniculata]